MRKWIVIIMSLLMLTGCWDKVEINDMAFVIALGVDVEEDQYVVTYVFPNLPVYTGQAEGESMFVRTVKDETMAGAAKKLAAQMNKSLNFEHLEAMVMGVSLLEDTERTDQLMDYLGRSSEYPRKIPVLATAGAKEALTPDEKQSEAVGEYINGIYENNQSVIRNYKLVLQDVLMQMDAGENLLIPVLYAQEGILGISNALVYDEGPVDILDMNELEALSWLREYAEGMEYAIALDAGHVSLEIDDASCEYEYQTDDDHIKITAHITARAQVKEYQAPGGSLLEPDTLKSLEAQTESQLQEDAESIVRVMQQEYKIDLASLLDPLKFKDKQLYLEVKDNWNNVWTEVEFTAEAEVIIEKIGIEE